MKRKKKEEMRILRHMLCAVLALSLLPGCDKWLEVQPYDQMAEDDLLSREEGARMGETEIKVAETAAGFIGRQMEQ